MFGLQESAQKETDSFVSLIDDIVSGKEKEVMEV
jgi:ribosome recycling factor